MWATVALAALSVAPAQEAPPSLINVRPTHGVLGPSRPDTKLLPGDVFYLTFDIDGLKVDKKEGRVLYSMALEILGKDGKSQFKRDPRDLEANTPLGGARISAFAAYQIPTDTAAGEYTMKVTVTDRASSAKKPVVLEKGFTVLPKALGIILLQLTYETGDPAPNLGVSGQYFRVNFFVTGFNLDAKMQPNLAIEMRILDEAGKPTLEEPFKGELKVFPDGVSEEGKKMAPFSYSFKANRPGKFRVEATAKDLNDKNAQPVKQTLDITINEQK